MDREEQLAITKETIFVKEYEYSKLASKPDLLTAYKYLYWACYRGHIHVANFLLHKCRISPFIITTVASNCICNFHVESEWKDKKTTCEKLKLSRTRAHVVSLTLTCLS